MLSAHLHVLRIGHDPLRERVEVAVSRHALHLHRHHGSRFVLVSGGHLIRESSQIPIILSIKFQGESSKSANDRKSRYKYVVHVAQCVTAERQSALAPPVRFPCDQGRDRRGGAGTWRMAPPRVRRANAHQTASNRIKPHQTASNRISVRRGDLIDGYSCASCKRILNPGFQDGSRRAL